MIRYLGEFMICRELKIPLHSYMGWDGPITNRQNLSFLAYLSFDMNIPGKVESYLMQLSMIVTGLVSKNRPSMDDFKIKFEHQKVLTPEEKKLSQEEKARLQKSVWMSHAGMDSEGNPLPNAKVITRKPQSNQPLTKPRESNVEVPPAVKKREIRGY